MFDFVRTHNRLFQFILLLLILPAFVLVGLDGYSRFMDESQGGVATVAGRKITQAEWDNAHRDQVERMRRQMPNVDPKMFDDPEVRQRTLDELVRERVTQAAAEDQHLIVTDERMARLFRADPQFAALRNADGTVNKGLLAAQGMNSEIFAYRLRQDLVQRQVAYGIGVSALGSSANAAVAFDALLQQRELQWQRFDAKDFAAKVSLSDADIEAFYKDTSNAKQFQLPERASIEYVVLDLDALKAGVTVSEEDLRKYYSENQSRYTVAEERRASHILIKAEKSAPADERNKAKARAEGLLADLRKNPGSFAEVARKNSQDEGSAQRGGDVDFFGRGAMVKPFEDATYALKQGEISPVVESDFGFHIIQLTGVRGGDKRSFDAVRVEIEDEVRKQLAQKRYAELAEQFGNTVYEQSDSLAPVADKLKLKVLTATVERTPAAGATGPLASAKLLDAVFGSEAINNKRNTEAVETAPSQLVSARIVQHQPARIQPLADVKSIVVEQLTRKKANELAQKAGEARLTELKGGADAAGLEPAVLVSRAQPQKLSRKVLEAALRADVSKLPGLIGVDTGEGAYMVLRINKVLPRDPAVVDAKRAAQQYEQAWAGVESQAYFNALKAHHKAQVLNKPAATK